LDLPQKAWNIMAEVKRKWTKELTRIDNGFFTTTPFFISFAPEASAMRRAYYSYLLGLVKLYEGEKEAAGKLFRESHQLNSDHLFCHYYSQEITVTRS